MRRGLLVWFLIMAAETLNGTLREIFLVPRMGAEMASRVGWPFGLLIVIGVATLCARWVGLRDTRRLLLLGALWAVLAVAFEVFIGWLRGYDGAAILRDLNPFAGGLVPYSALVMFLAPLIAARIRRI